MIWRDTHDAYLRRTIAPKKPNNSSVWARRQRPWQTQRRRFSFKQRRNTPLWPPFARELGAFCCLARKPGAFSGLESGQPPVPQIDRNFRLIPYEIISIAIDSFTISTCPSLGLARRCGAPPPARVAHRGGFIARDGCRGPSAFAAHTRDGLRVVLAPRSGLFNGDRLRRALVLAVEFDWLGHRERFFAGLAGSVPLGANAFTATTSGLNDPHPGPTPLSPFGGTHSGLSGTTRLCPRFASGSFRNDVAH